MRTLRNQLALCVAIYIAATGLLYIFQRNFIYYPHDSHQQLSEIGANAALVDFPVHTSDGLALSGLYAEAKEKRYTLVFFHGNGDSLETIAGMADPYIKAGYGVLLAEYRGYSGEPGSPTEEGLYEDGRAYIEALHTKGVSSRDIVLYAHSLGSGVAVQLATEYPNLAGIVLLAPYTSLVDIAQLRFKIFPVALLLQDRFDNMSKIKRINSPLLVVNGDRDDIIPPKQGKDLYDEAPQPKLFQSFPQAGHNDLFEPMVAPLLDWLEKLPNISSSTVG